MATIYEKMTALANAVRTKTGRTDTLTLDEMASGLNGIPEKGSADLTASGATVSVPAGNYKEAVSKSVATTTQATPSISIDSAGKITATSTQEAGYVSTGTKTGTKQLTIQAEKTITPSTSSQTAVAAGVYTTGEITVAAMPSATQATPSISVSNDGLITASATQTAGYVVNGTKTATKQLTVQAAKTIIPSIISQTAVASEVYTTGEITVEAVPSETKNITSNGTYNPSIGKWFSSVNVNVPDRIFNTQTKSVTPTEYEQIVVVDADYDGLSSVTVGAISSTYIGSGVTRKPAATYTPTESKQTIAAGQYLDGAQTISAIPSTYVGSGVPTQAAKTVTPSTSVQTAVSSGTYVTGDIKVAAMPTGVLSTPAINTNTGVVTAGVSTAGYLGTGATKTLQLNTKSAATIVPSTIDQTIAAGQYLTGIQTIKGDANLVAENIASGVSIFGIAGTHSSIDTSDATAINADIVSGKTAYVNGSKITGTLVVQNYYTGTTTPESTTGEDGDLYFKVSR